MDLTHLLQQTASWEAVVSGTDRDDRVYAAAVTLPCRSVSKLRDVISRDGEVTTSTNTLTLIQPVGISDLLDGREVIAIEDMTDFTGTVRGHLAHTR